MSFPLIVILPEEIPTSESRIIFNCVNHLLEPYLSSSCDGKSITFAEADQIYQKYLRQLDKRSLPKPTFDEFYSEDNGYYNEKGWGIKDPGDSRMLLNRGKIYSDWTVMCDGGTINIDGFYDLPDFPDQITMKDAIDMLNVNSNLYSYVLDEKGYMNTRSKLGWLISGQSMMSDAEWRMCTQRIIHQASENARFVLVVCHTSVFDSSFKKFTNHITSGQKYTDHMYSCGGSYNASLVIGSSVTCHKDHTCLHKYEIEVNVSLSGFCDDSEEDSGYKYTLRGFLHMHTENYGTIIFYYSELPKKDPMDHNLAYFVKSKDDPDTSGEYDLGFPNYDVSVGQMGENAVGDLNRYINKSKYIRTAELILMSHPYPSKITRHDDEISSNSDSNTYFYNVRIMFDLGTTIGNTLEFEISSDNGNYIKNSCVYKDDNISDEDDDDNISDEDDDDVVEEDDDVIS